MIRKLVDGYLDVSVPEFLLAKIEEEVYGPPNKPYNEKLAGNIKREFILEKCREFVAPYVQQQAMHFGRGKYRLTDLWVNYMAKHEFNPPHAHGGDLSFVIFIEVPYNIKDELAEFPNTSASCAGHFSFHYNNLFGEQCEKIIPVDRSYEGSMFMFPAKLRHSVYPFYTSDYYRITVAGNLIRA